MLNDDWYEGENWSPDWSGMFCFEHPPGPEDDAYVGDNLFGTHVELSNSAWTLPMAWLSIRTGFSWMPAGCG
jgi:hypothetical protein